MNICTDEYICNVDSAPLQTWVSMTQFTNYLQARSKDHETAAALRSLQGGCRKKWAPLTPPAILPVLLKLVEVCQSSELR